MPHQGRTIFYFPWKIAFEAGIKFKPQDIVNNNNRIKKNIIWKGEIFHMVTRGWTMDNRINGTIPNYPKINSQNPP